MPRITLTDFVEIVSSSGTAKTTKVREKLNREEYHPAKDFYKKIREKIVDVHRNDLPKETLIQLIPLLSDKKKLTIYPTIIDSYIAWWGKKKVNWFEPVHETITSGNLEVSINPELGLEIKDSPYLIKLYFKGEPLTKNKADIIMEIMKMYLSANNPPNSIMAVLDIQRKKLFVPTVKIESLDITVKAELAYISAFL